MTASASASAAPVRRLFGTDGVRGVANSELSPQVALALGAAAGLFLRDGDRADQTVVVGRDPRISGDVLESALVAGLLSQGVSVVSVGVVPTPGVAWITRQRGAAFGIVISASHNPVQDNGIKFFGPNGKKLPDDTEARIEQFMEGWEARPRPSGPQVGRVARDPGPVDGYAQHLVESAQGIRLDGLRLVLDGANGAASFLTQPVFEELGAIVETIFCEPDGVNINAGCGSTHPQTLAARVRETSADAGAAFDGDADRVILADAQGRIFDGDRILYALGVHLAQQHRLNNGVVVGTVMSNLGLEKALEKHQIRLVRAPVGDRYVFEQMTRHGANLGGEKSGHILLPDLTPTGDGMLTAIAVLKLVQESGKSLSEWADEMPEYPQKLVSVYVRERDGWNTHPAVAEALHFAETTLAGKGRLVVRPSGTEKMVRVMAEGPDESEVETAVGAVVDALRAHLGVQP